MLNSPSWDAARRFLWPAAAVLVLLAVAVFPAGAFVVDEAIYARMARAMADRLEFAVDGPNGVAAAPPLVINFTDQVGNRVIPQYPGGYAVIAAPFMWAFGVRGLYLLNAVSALVSVFLTGVLARRLLKGSEGVWVAPLLLGAATYLPNYAFAIWPHALTLAFSLGATACLVVAVGSTGPSRWLLSAATGLLCGLAVTVRVDAILQLVALFAWLRVFALPGDRRAGLAFLSGAAAGLAVAALLNFAKYGVLSPIWYGPEESAAQTQAAYAPVAVAAAVVLAAVTFIDVRALPWRRLRSRPALAVATVVGLVGAWVFRDRVMDLLKGAYVLLFDLNALPDDKFQPTLVRNADGYVDYWGRSKKALFQSLPYGTLMIWPTIQFLRGKRWSEVALCLLMVAAPVMFYGLKYWHGGMSYDMRYFMPTLPFLCLLTAMALRDLQDAAPVAKRMDWVFRGLAAGVALIVVAELSPATVSRGLLIYPQMLAALACGGLAATAVFRSGFVRAAAVAGYLCIGLAVAVCASDLARYGRDRGSNASMGHEVLAMAPAGALIVSHTTAPYVEAVERGRFTVSPFDPGATRAALAFAREGRCVLVREENGPPKLPLPLSPMGRVEGLGDFMAIDPGACSRAQGPPPAS